MTNKLQQYKEVLLKSNRNSQELKESYLAIITDKSISLEDRWEIFVTAPNEFKHHDPYIQHFDTIKKNFPYFTLYDEMNIEKEEKVVMTEFIDSFNERMQDQELYPDEQDEIGSKLFKEPEILDQLKEEILAKNLGSFLNDW